MAGASRIVRLVSAQDDTDLSIELQEGVNRIGRQRTDNHIVLVSPQVSRFHAEIDVGKDILVRDLSSANGTFVNGERVSERRLQPGDLVGFSDQFTLRLTIDMLEDPSSMTLSSGRGPDAMPKAPPPKAPALLSVDSVPISLEERNRRLQSSKSYRTEEPTNARRPPTGPVFSTPVPDDKNAPVPYSPMNTGPQQPGLAQPAPRRSTRPRSVAPKSHRASQSGAGQPQSGQSQ
ncbi:MAG: FHA domain-containing protein, partial [Myxococcales bacterium]|nr:FHA domain-containing protein [Myxococcales bacterium]